MEFQEFWKERARMCQGVVCVNCPFNAKVKRVNGSFSECAFYVSKYPQEAERIVEQWAKEHPVMTNGEKFAEIFGKHTFCQSGFQFTINTPDMGNTFKTFGEWLKQEYQTPKGEEGMTREEALKWFKYRKSMGLDDRCQQAENVAIHSLEAWDKVIEDINKSLSMVEDTGIRTGYVIAEKIIKDHLNEVEK